MKKRLLMLSATILFLGILHFSGYGIPKSALMCRLVHMMFYGQEILKPQILEEFNFWEKGYSKTIQFNPKYAEIYSIGIITPRENLPATYKYSGALKLEIYSKNRLLYESTITQPKAIFYREHDTNFIKEIVFEDFEVPLKGRRSDLRLKLTVIEPDSYLEKYKESGRLFIGVSGLP